MEYELIQLEQFVTVSINPARLKIEKLTGKLLDQYASDCYSEIERIKKRFTVAIFEAPDEVRIRIYVRQHQASLTRLADDIYQYLKSNELSDSDLTNDLIIFYKNVDSELTGLLKFLEENFGEYFDLSAKLTRTCDEQFIKELKSHFKKIRTGFIKHSINNELTEIACNPFEKVLADLNTITFRKRKYLQLMILKLQKLQTDVVKLTNEQICNELIILNYNSTRFFSYLIQHIEKEAKLLSSANDLVIFFSLQLKRLRQLPVGPQLAFNDDLINLREQLVWWISEEQNALQMQSPSAGITYTMPDHTSSPKIHTTLSVAQLSFALKLLIDSGIIANTNFSDLTKMVAQNFRTGRAENISEDSLRNKYYNIERITADKMKDVVGDLLNLVRKY